MNLQKHYLETAGKSKRVLARDSLIESIFSKLTEQSCTPLDALRMLLRAKVTFLLQQGTDEFELVHRGFGEKREEGYFSQFHHQVKIFNK